MAPPGTPPTSAHPETAHHREVELVRSVAVRPGDLPRGFGSTNWFGSQGNSVIGYVTMDLCGASFESEILRTARRQVGYRGPSKHFVSTETVSYRDGGAAQAMTELRQAIRTCPTGYVDSTVADAPPRKEDIHLLTHEPGWFPDSVAFTLTDTYKHRSSVHGVLVYQRQGNVMTAAYVYSGRDSSALAQRVATLLANRLKAATRLSTASAASG